MSHYDPYPEYKDSGAAWLGDVPEHWQVKRVCHVASVIDPQPDHRAPTLALGDGFPYIGIRDINDDGSVNFLTARKIEEHAIIKQEENFSIDDGDIVFCKVGTLGFPRHIKPHGRLALSATLVLIKPSDLIDQKYLRYALDARCTYGQIDFFSSGSTRAALSIEQIRGFNIATPSLSEQREISVHLDLETTRIDGLVNKKSRFIELLREKRQALITHAVTKGLDSNAKMKDSGVPWLEEVPAHWAITYVKRVIVSIGQGWSPQCESHPAADDEWGVLKVGCVNGERFRAAENKALPLTLTPKPEFGLKKGDVLVSRANTRELVGSCAVITEDFPRLMICDKLYRLIVNNSKVSPAFLAMLISVYGRREVEVEANGASASMVNIAQSVILNLNVALPPFKEQLEIISAIETDSAHIDTLISKTLLSIDLLKERRSALITAAVTGQIDLREVG